MTKLFYSIQQILNFIFTGEKCGKLIILLSIKTLTSLRFREHKGNFTRVGLCEEVGGERKRGDILILRICFNVSFGVKCLKRQSFRVKTNIVWVRGSSEFTGIVSIIKTRVLCVYYTKRLHSWHIAKWMPRTISYVCIWLIISEVKNLVSCF